MIYVAYAILQCAVLQPEPYYSVYDSDGWAKARWFLLKRLGLASGQSHYFTPGSDYALFNSTTIAGNPGGANRWRLGQDSSGDWQSLKALGTAEIDELTISIVADRIVAMLPEVSPSYTTASLCVALVYDLSSGTGAAASVQSKLGRIVWHDMFQTQAMLDLLRMMQRCTCL